VSRSADAARSGSSACLSCAAGLNLSAMVVLHAPTTLPRGGCSGATDIADHVPRAVAPRLGDAVQCTKAGTTLASDYYW
jgi:hypothetical protein